MQAAGYGRIVSIASEAGRVGSKGSAVYSAAKGGVIAFMKVIAREGARFGITANSIAPGPIETPLLMGALEFGEIGEKIVENMKAGTQLRRLGQPEEVAAAVAFLASDDASYVTGETLGVSGGMGMVGEPVLLEPGDRARERRVRGRGPAGHRRRRHDRGQRALDPGDDRDDGALLLDPRLREPPRGPGDGRLRGLHQARRRRARGRRPARCARPCARSPTSASCASTSRSPRASARSASAPTSAA